MLDNQSLGSMYIHKDQANKLLDEVFRNNHEKLNEANDFLANLAKEDDWSFVIKSHALIEASVTNLITSVLGNEQIYNLIERLPLSDTRIGKIVFGKNLGILDDNQRRFIKWYSELRNHLVHKVENIDFSFEEHWKTLDKNQRNACLEAIDTAGTKKTPNTDFRNLIEKQTKIALWITIISLISFNEAYASQPNLQKNIDKTAASTTQAHIKDQDKLIKAQNDLIQILEEALNEK